MSKLPNAVPHRRFAIAASCPSPSPEKGGTGIVPERGGTGLSRHGHGSRSLLLLAALFAASVDARDHLRIAGELSGPALLSQRADGTIEMSFLLPAGRNDEILLVARGLREGEDAWLEVSRHHARGTSRVGGIHLLFSGCAAEGILSLDLDALIKAEHGGTGKPGDEEDPNAPGWGCGDPLAKAEHGGTGKPGGDDDPDGHCDTPIAKAEHGGTGSPPPPPPGGKRAEALELVFSLGSPDPACLGAVAMRTP